MVPKFPRKFINKYNDTVASVQGYFGNKPFTSQYDYEVQSFLYQVGVPRKDNSLLAYMKRYDLTWSDLNTDKTLSLYSSRATGYQAYTFVSRNINKLYK